MGDKKYNNLINIYSMKTNVLSHFEHSNDHRNDVTITVKPFYREEGSLRPSVKVDQASRPLPQKRLSILEDLTLNLIQTLCVIEMVWTFGCL